MHYLVWNPVRGCYIRQDTARAVLDYMADVTHGGTALMVSEPTGAKFMLTVTELTRLADAGR